MTFKIETKRVELAAGEEELLITCEASQSQVRLICWSDGTWASREEPAGHEPTDDSRHAREGRGNP